jgi:hypothetical protein
MAVQHNHPGATIRLLGVIPDGSWEDEQILHRRFAALRVRTAPNSEWFHPEPELLNYIRSQAANPVRKSPRRERGPVTPARPGATAYQQAAGRDWTSAVDTAERGNVLRPLAELLLQVARRRMGQRAE